MNQVIELRQYTLRPGRRERLISLFEREFVEPQEALGLRVLGTFRDLDDDDRFAWLRGFADMDTRARALAGFYGGPVWQRHRDEANATMVDSDDVRLLRPAGGGLRLDDLALPAHPPRDARPRPGLVVATVCPLPAPAGDDLALLFDRVVRPHWSAAGAAPFGTCVSETAPNNYPRLPVREGEPVFVWLAAFAGEAAWRRHAMLLQDAPGWRHAAAAWRERLAGDPQTVRWAPTARSALQP